MNFLESRFQISTQPAALPHLGEVYGVWVNYVLCSSALSFCQVVSNHVREPELKQIIRGMIEDLWEPQMRAASAFLTRDSPGARFEDVEVANLQAMKLQLLLTTSNANLQQVLREDIAGMYMRFHSVLLSKSLELKKLMQARGWLIVPPLYASASVSH